MSETAATTERTRIRRKAERGRHDLDTIHAILDEGFVCHLGFAVDGRPWVFPTAYGRVGDDLYVHGAVGNFGLRTLASGAEVCVTVTLIDGLVLAKSAFHHSMNYRSVMVFGVAEAVTDEDEKRAVTMAIVNHLIPGRAEDTRPPTSAELRQTLVLRIPIDEASAKVRTGGPIDDAEDGSLPYWAGVLPLALESRRPDGDDAPAYVTAWHRRSESGPSASR